MELCSRSCGSLDEKGVWGRMDTCICIAESFLCPSETITTLSVCYTPIQNKKCFYKRVLLRSSPANARMGVKKQKQKPTQPG